MAIAGYQCLVRKSGTTTALTAEPMSLVTGSVQFQITASAKRCIDPSVDWSIVDNGTTVAYSKLSTVDYLFGIFTFASPASSTASLVFNGSYLPITTSSDLILESRNYSLKESAMLLDSTVFTGTPTLKHRKRITGLQDVDITVESIAKQADLATLQTYHDNGTEVVVEISFGDNTEKRFRGLCLVDSIQKTSQIDAVYVSQLTFKAAAVGNQTSGFAGGFSWVAFP